MLDGAGGLLFVVALASGGLLHSRALSAADVRGLLASLSLLVVALLLSFLALGDVGAFERLLQEDGPAEWATVIAFVIAALLYGKRALGREAPWLTRAAFVALSAFCVFVAGEEISWGQRLFAIEPPAVFLEHNFQQELNLHNLLTKRELGGLKLDTRFFVALLALLYGGLLPLVARRLERSSFQLLRAVGAVAPHPLLSTGFLLVAAAELIYPVRLTGEAAELLLGLCFVASAGLSFPSGSRGLTPALVAASLLLGGLTPALVDRLWYGSHEERVALAHEELEALADELRREGVLHVRRLKRLKGLHKRVFTAAKEGYFRLPDDEPEGGDESAMSRRRWFLDPWKNPYWIVWSRKHERFTLYSFGPDRRRSGNHGRSTEAQGDDIAIHFHAPW